MITSWLLQRLLDWRTYAILALIVASATLSHKIFKGGYAKGYAQAIIINQTKIIDLEKQIKLDTDLYNQSLIESSRTQTEWMNKLQVAEHHANESEKQLKIISAKSTGIIDRLRVTTNEGAKRASLPATPEDTRNDYIATLSDVFTDCTGKYLNLAEQTSRVEIDKQKLIDAYPSLTNRHEIAPND